MDDHPDIATLPLDAAASAVILARGHVCDLESARDHLCREQPYAGMICSSRKTRLILDQPRSEGAAEEALDAETPSEIAISILAQMIACRGKATMLPAPAAARAARRA